MKRCVIFVILIAVALPLLSARAYALDKEKHPEPVIQLANATREEDTLKAELLAATEEHQNNDPGIDNNNSDSQSAPPAHAESDNKNLNNKAVRGFLRLGH